MDDNKLNILKVNILPELYDLTINTIYMVSTGDDRFELYVTSKSDPITIKKLSGINGSVFITDIFAQTSGNVGDKIFSSNGVVLDECLVDTQLVTVHVLALPGNTNYNSTVNIVVGDVVEEVTMIPQTDGPIFKGTIDIDLTNVEELKVLHEDGAEHSMIINYEDIPIINDCIFINDYPGAQTELKENDTFDIQFETDVDIIKVQIDNYGSFKSLTQSLSAGTSHIITGIIANRGNISLMYGTKIRVQKSTGSWSEWYLTENDGNIDGENLVQLNNLYPSISFGSVMYPPNQEAIKDLEQAVINNNVLNFDDIIYTSPLLQVSIDNPNIYETEKDCNRIAGDYNITQNNIKIEANRNANNATTIQQSIVKIAHVAAEIQILKPSRLRSGGNDGTSEQSHQITISANQHLIETPSLNAPIGIFSGSNFVGSTTTWTRNLLIHDDLVKGSYNWGTLQTKNLAGIITTSITGDINYVLGGFVSREIILAPFGLTSVINVGVVDYTKTTLSWSYNANVNEREPVGTSAPPAQPNKWSINTLNSNPTEIRILDIEQANASSAPSTLILEESI